MVPETGGEQFGRYRLIERIGYGGMAEVFRATYSPSPGFDKVLVVKRILPHLSEDPRFINMFQDEASITVHLSHPNVVQVFDFGSIDGLWFLAMEYIHGRNLRQLLRRLTESGRAVPIGLAAYITAEVSRGLAYAHEARDKTGQALGIIHRDLNPPNILLSYQGDVKIADFGIAKAERRLEKTEAGRIKGKIEYTAPEVLLGHSADHRADLWALGCLLYEMLTGQHPFPVIAEDALASKILKITQEKYTPVSRLRDGIPAPLERAVDLLLKKNPKKRPVSAAEIATVASAVVPPTARARLGDMLEDLFGSAHAVEATPSAAPPSGEDFSIPSGIQARVDELGDWPTTDGASVPGIPAEPPAAQLTPSGIQGIEEAISAAVEQSNVEPGTPDEELVEEIVREATIADKAPPPGEPGPTLAPVTVRAHDEPAPASTPPPEPSLPGASAPREPTPSPPPRREPTPVEVKRATASTPSVEVEPFEPAPRAPRRAGVLLLVLGVPVVLLGLVGAFFFATRSGWLALGPRPVSTTRATAAPTTPPEAVTSTPQATASAAPATPPPTRAAAPTRVPTSTPAATAVASLRVTSVPRGANVQVNGEAVGTTPYTGSFPVGTTLRVEVAQPGRRTFRKTLELGRPGATVSAKLPVLGKGKLRLASQPWAEVYIDGQPLRRQTPVLDLVLPEGTHTVRLVNNLEQLRREIRVEIRAGETTSKSVNLRTGEIH